MTMRYCPQCASPLGTREIEGRPRLSCPACDYVFWNNPVPVVAAILEQDDHILLARKAGLPPELWILFAGFVEPEETTEEAVLREIGEETGLQGEILGLVGVYSLPQRNQIFIVYRVRVEQAEPRMGEELEAIRAFTRGEIPLVLRYLPPQSGAGRALRDWLDHWQDP